LNSRTAPMPRHGAALLRYVVELMASGWRR
jgi:hypothetical protein